MVRATGLFFLLLCVGGCGSPQIKGIASASTPYHIVRFPDDDTRPTTALSESVITTPIYAEPDPDPLRKPQRPLEYLPPRVLIANGWIFITGTSSNGHAIAGVDGGKITALGADGCRFMLTNFLEPNGESEPLIKSNRWRVYCLEDGASSVRVHLHSNSTATTTLQKGKYADFKKSWGTWSADGTGDFSEASEGSENQDIVVKKNLQRMFKARKDVLIDP